jgi:hypothetical protein
MHKLFNISDPFRIPDGTLISPFMNPMDSKGNLQSGMFKGFSIAAGIIEAGTNSKIHLMPFVTQATFVRHGALEAQMKGPRDEFSYLVRVQANQAVLTEPGAFLQLSNRGTIPCHTLYVVSPAYLYEVVDGLVIYDDSIVFDEDWDALKRAGWRPAVQIPTMEQRQECEARLTARR